MKLPTRYDSKINRIAPQTGACYARPMIYRATLLRQRRKAAGLCYACGSPSPNAARCIPCAARAARQVKALRRRKAGHL